MELPSSLYGATVTEGKIHEMSGFFDERSLALIRNGVKCSTLVEERIKQML